MLTTICTGIHSNRVLSIDDLHDFLRIHDLYTCGSNQDYDELFNYLSYCNLSSSGLSDNDLYLIAVDVLQHSNRDCGYEVEELMTVFASKCLTTFKLDILNVND